MVGASTSMHLEAKNNAESSVQATSSIDQLLQQNGIDPKGNPFEVFYFIIMVVFMQDQTKSQTDNINQFASQMQSVNKCSEEWTQVRAAFFAGDQDAGGGDTSQIAMCKGIAHLLNTIFGKFMDSPQWPYGKFNEDLDEGRFSLDGNKFNALMAAFTTGGVDPNQWCPTLGDSAVDLLKSLDSMSGLFMNTWDAPMPPMLLSQMWEQANQDPVTHNLPDPINLQVFTNSLSDVSGVLNGMGGIESSKLQMAQQVFNRLLSFVKDMLNDWMKQRSSFGRSMSQANS